MQATRELRSTGINVSRTASGGHAALATAFFACLSAEFDLSSPRGNEKRGPRSEACHASEWLCLELLSLYLGQVEECFTSSPWKSY